MLPLIPLFPFLGFLVNTALGRRLPKSVSGGLACLVMLASFAVSLLEVWRLVALPPGGREVVQTVYTWIASGDFVVDVAFRLDPLSAVMILVVTGIGSLIHIYSTAYMLEETDSEYARYFSYLNLFVFFMLVLVLGSNVLAMFVGWEGVGLCSYLLIGYYFRRQSAADAAKKAFVVNRVGDYAFILGTLLMVVTFGSLDFKVIAAQVAALPPEVTFGTLSIITLLLFIGATGKSAQIPLYTWLPDAMEGPTPVSALIHAATMVTAGVYLIGRNAVLFEHAPMTLAIVAVVGIVTALFAGTIALVQNDIKRVLAYSTVSQLGYMFLAMGVGAFGAGIFHLYTHAFFKALLFLGSGAVIHALHGEQDIRNMGGLKRHLPITYWTFLIGSLAIAGVPGLAGFFSKDEILFETFYRGHQWLWAAGIITSLLTATYMFRLVYLTFHGEPRFQAAAAARHAAPGHGAGHDIAFARASDASPDASRGGAERVQPGHEPARTHGAPGHPSTAPEQMPPPHPVHLHDAPPAMAIALVLLALGSVTAGYIGIPHALGGHNQLGEFLEPAFQPPPPATLSGAAGLRGRRSLGEGGQPRSPEPPALALAALQVAQPPAGQPLDIGQAAADDHAKEQLELMLMAVSSLIALGGIGLATLFFLKRPEQAERMARRLPGLHRLLLNKYYVDEFYDATIVQPVKTVSEEGLWRGVDVRVLDGAVNGAGTAVAGASAVLRLLQSGSVKAYAASLFLGVVLILAYYSWR